MPRTSMEVAQHFESDEASCKGFFNGANSEDQEDFRSNSIAILRAKAQEHSTKMMEGGGGHQHQSEQQQQP